jgi:hypothetical protein
MKLFYFFVKIEINETLGLNRVNLISLITEGTRKNYSGWRKTIEYPL